MDNPSDQDVRQALQEWRTAHEGLDKAMSKFYSLEQEQPMPVLTDDDIASTKREREAFDNYQNLLQKYNEAKQR